LGPVLELRVQEERNALTTERAGQSLDYWRTTSQQLLSDTESSGSFQIVATYSKMAAAQGNLFAEHNLTTEAEQAYRIASEIFPGCPEAAFGLSEVLARTGRSEEARRILDEFEKNNPAMRDAANASREALFPKFTSPAKR